jgi:hypothetical protein
MFHLLLELVLQEFDNYLAIYIFSILQQQFQPQKDYDQVLMVQLYVFLSNITDPTYIQ